MNLLPEQLGKIPYKIAAAGFVLLASQLTVVAQQKVEETDTTRKVHVLQEIVISASRLQEKQLTAPVSDAFVAAVNKDVNTQGLSQAAAMEKNKGGLQRNTYTYLQPEQMHSFEVGYRSILATYRPFSMQMPCCSIHSPILLFLLK